MKRVVYYIRKQSKIAGQAKANRLTIFCIVLILIFLLIGVFNCKYHYISDNSLLISICRQYYDICISRTLFHILISSCGVMLIFSILSYIMSLSCFGMTENMILLAIYGLLQGHLFGYLYSVYKLKGIIFAICTQLPAVILQVYALAQLTRSTINLSYRVFKNVFTDNKSDLCFKIKKHSMLCIRSAVLGLICFVIKVICYFVFTPYIHL